MWPALRLQAALTLPPSLLLLQLLRLLLLQALMLLLCLRCHGWAPLRVDSPQGQLCWRPLKPGTPGPSEQLLTPPWDSPLSPERPAAWAMPGLWKIKIGLSIPCLREWDELSILRCVTDREHASTIWRCVQVLWSHPTLRQEGIG